MYSEILGLKMNAIKLADELKNHIKTLKYETTESIGVATAFYEECEAMLRQLHAENESLKEQLETSKDEYCQLLNGEDY